MTKKAGLFRAICCYLVSPIAVFAEGPLGAVSREDWLSRSRKVVNNGDFDAQPYAQLAKVLSETGDEAGAKDVNIALEYARRQQQHLGFVARCWAFIFRLTIGYGYDTSRALWFIVAFVTVGSVLFFLGNQAIVPTNAAARKFNPFIYSLENFLPLVDLGQSKFWTPDASSKIGRSLRWYLWLHVLAGWFFTSMFIAFVTGLKK